MSDNIVGMGSGDNLPDNVRKLLESVSKNMDNTVKSNGLDDSSRERISGLSREIFHQCMLKSLPPEETIMALILIQSFIIGSVPNPRIRSILYELLKDQIVSIAERKARLDQR